MRIKSFILKNIGRPGKERWELHFSGLEGVKDRKEANKILNRDFCFSIENKWMVSANCPSNGPAYIRGSNNWRLGNKHYYNRTRRTFHNEEDFLRETEAKYPLIKKKGYEGEFDEKTRLMRLSVQTKMNLC